MLPLCIWSKNSQNACWRTTRNVSTEHEHVPWYTQAGWNWSISEFGIYVLLFAGQLLTMCSKGFGPISSEKWEWLAFQGIFFGDKQLKITLTLMLCQGTQSNAHHSAIPVTNKGINLSDGQKLIQWILDRLTNLEITLKKSSNQWASSCLYQLMCFCYFRPCCYKMRLNRATWIRWYTLWMTQTP